MIDSRNADPCSTFWIKMLNCRQSKSLNAELSTFEEFECWIGDIWRLKMLNCRHSKSSNVYCWHSESLNAELSTFCELKCWIVDIRRVRMLNCRRLKASNAELSTFKDLKCWIGDAKNISSFAKNWFHWKTVQSCIFSLCGLKYRLTFLISSGKKHALA